LDVDEPPDEESPKHRSRERRDFLALARGVRLDLLIAVCALLISSLAAGASFWQARVLEEQLGAQVWPYVAVSYDIEGDTVKISINNDGLGPAVLRSETLAVDGVRERTFIDVMHAVLGPHVLARLARGERAGIHLDSSAPGSVVRPAESIVAYSLTSKHFAAPLLRAIYKRVDVTLCYCAIIPGKCWQSDVRSTHDPVSVSDCPEIANDALHASGVGELLDKNL
jgi:hypothetical protein